MRGRLAIAVLVCAFVVTGCSKKEQPQATPSFDTQVSASATPPSGSPTAQATGGTNSNPYPKDAKAYAQALLSAWGQKDKTRISQLAIQAAAQQIADNGYPNSNWNSFQGCNGDGPAHTACTFQNADGDTARIRLLNSQLGNPTAVTEAQLMRMRYATNAGDYASDFVQAWREKNTEHMKRLSNSTVTSFFQNKIPANGYTIGVSEMDASHWKVELSGLPVGEMSYVLKVNKAAIGKPGAIVQAS